MATVYRLPNVRLFASGVFRSRPWPPAVVAAVGSGVRKLGPQGDNLIVPPVVLGHDDDQEWLSRTDLPAAGWVDPSTVRCEPDEEHPGHLVLVGDIVNVPEEVAELIRSGKYRYGSAEVYDSFLDDMGEDRGPALRRFALLGGEVPQVKRLRAVPAPQPMAAPVAFSETPRRLRPAARPTYLLAFAERTTVTREEAIAAIKAAMPNVTAAWFDGIPDEKLVEMVAALPQPATTPTEPPAAPMADETQPGMPAADPMSMSRDDLIAALTGMGQDAALLQGMDDQALRELAKTLMASPMGEGCKDKVSPMSERPKPGKPQTPAEKAAAETMTRFAEMNRQLDAEQKALAGRKAAFRRQQAEAFCEDLVRKGVLRPFEKADYVETLARLDDTAPVHTFTEGGKTVAGLTAFARKQKELAARPVVVRFGEKVPTGGGAGGEKPDKAAAVQKATAFAEANERPLKAAGYTPQRFVAKFAEMFDANPDLALKTLPDEYRA